MHNKVNLSRQSCVAIERVLHGFYCTGFFSLASD